MTALTLAEKYYSEGKHDFLHGNDNNPYAADQDIWQYAAYFWISGYCDAKKDWEWQQKINRANQAK